jgi:DNA-binding transcriptional ArsR family regulator
MRLTSDQIACFGSPTTIEVYQAIAELPEATAATVASHIGKSVHSVYYHLNRLQSVGLIRIKEERKVARTKLAIFEPVARELQFQVDPDEPDSKEQAVRRVRRFLRAAERDFQAAVETKKSGDADRSMVLRMRVKLDAESLEELKTQLHQAALKAKEREVKGGALHTLTLVLAPNVD